MFEQKIPERMAFELLRQQFANNQSVEDALSDLFEIAKSVQEPLRGGYSPILALHVVCCSKIHRTTLIVVRSKSISVL